MSKIAWLRKLSRLLSQPGFSRCGLFSSKAVTTLTIATVSMRITSLTYKSGIAHLELRSPQMVGLLSEKTLLAHGQFYFSISEAQFRRIESGAALASSIFVMIRNLCPSPLTS